MANPIPPARRFEFMALLATVFALYLASLLGCAHKAPEGPATSAVGMSEINPDKPLATALQEAKGQAEERARRQLLDQVSRMELSDGRELGELAVVDPFVRAVLDDTIRNSQTIVDRAADKRGTLTVTVRMDLKPIYRMIENYHTHAIK